MKAAKTDKKTVINNLKKTLRQGDIIFTSIGGPLFRRIASSTGSWTSHVGMVLKGKNGEWLVAESKVPFSRFSTLESFVGRSIGSQVATRRIKRSLSDEEISLLRKSAEKRMGKIYDFSYDINNSKSQYCSKFVYEVYREALNIEIGSNESFSELYAKFPQMPLTFWKLWYLGRIPWEMHTVTPASQFNDESLDDVFQHIA